MKVITFSRQFPAYHPKIGQPTFFVEKITSLLSVISPGWSAISQFEDLRKACLFNEGVYRRCQENEIYKSHTIRSGKRWRQGEWASLRVWSDRPYASKQIEFARVQLTNVWDFVLDLRHDSPIAHIDGVLASPQELRTIAVNDGLDYKEFINWFSKPFPINEAGMFRGQILSWNENINY
jgi:hypothetical protein